MCKHYHLRQWEMVDFAKGNYFPHLLKKNKKRHLLERSDYYQMIFFDDLFEKFVFHIYDHQLYQEPIIYSLNKKLKDEFEKNTCVNNYENACTSLKTACEKNHLCCLKYLCELYEPKLHQFTIEDIIWDSIDCELLDYLIDVRKIKMGCVDYDHAIASNYDVKVIDYFAKKKGIEKGDFSRRDFEDAVRRNRFNPFLYHITALQSFSNILICDLLRTIIRNHSYSSEFSNFLECFVENVSDELLNDYSYLVEEYSSLSHLSSVVKLICKSKNNIVFETKFFNVIGYMLGIGVDYGYHDIITLYHKGYLGIAQNLYMYTAEYHFNRIREPCGCGSCRCRVYKCCWYDCLECRFYGSCHPHSPDTCVCSKECREIDSRNRFYFTVCETQKYIRNLFDDKKHYSSAELDEIKNTVNNMVMFFSEIELYLDRRDHYEQYIEVGNTVMEKILNGKLALENHENFPTNYPTNFPN